MNTKLLTGAGCLLMLAAALAPIALAHAENDHSPAVAQRPADACPAPTRLATVGQDAPFDGRLREDAVAKTAINPTACGIGASGGGPGLSGTDPAPALRQTAGPTASTTVDGACGGPGSQAGGTSTALVPTRRDAGGSAADGPSIAANTHGDRPESAGLGSPGSPPLPCEAPHRPGRDGGAAATDPHDLGRAGSARLDSPSPQGTNQHSAKPA